MFKLINCYFQNMFNFKGRIARKDYWLTILSTIPIALIVNLLIIFTPTTVIGLVFWVLLSIANTSLACRRLHDINRSGFILLGHFVCLVITVIMSMQVAAGSAVRTQDLSPVIFVIFLILTLVLSITILIFTVTKGSETANNYGEVPERIIK